MRLRKIPIAGCPISFMDIGQGLKIGKRDYIQLFEDGLSRFLGSRYCFLTGSGKTSFFVILKTLRKLSNGTEVILPAYTDCGLVLVIQSLGLKPILCDISLETFNLSIGLLPQLISERTLCIVPVHMFGLACQVKPIIELAKDKGIFVVEDAAQALGTSLNGQMVGSIADLGFSSFNRGKNFPTYSGGCIVTNNPSLAKAVREEIEIIPELSISSKAILSFKLFLLSLAVRPLIYGLFYPAIALFKSNKPPRKYKASRYILFQAKVGLSMMGKLGEFSRKRYLHGSILYEGLKKIDGLELPKIILGSIPAYNRLPVIFKDEELKGRIQKRLLKFGIESSPMYPGPIHRIFNLGFRTTPDPFPKSTYLAQKLLSLPTHPLVDEETLRLIIKVFKKP